MAAADASVSGAPQLVPLPVKMQDAMNLVPLEPDTRLAAKPASDQAIVTDHQAVEPPNTVPLTVAPRITPGYTDRSQARWPFN